MAYKPRRAQRRAGQFSQQARPAVRGESAAPNDVLFDLAQRVADTEASVEVINDNLRVIHHLLAGLLEDVDDIMAVFAAPDDGPEPEGDPQAYVDPDDDRDYEPERELPGVEPPSDDVRAYEEPEPEPDESPEEEAARLRQEAEEANSATLEELAALEHEPNDITSVPPDGVVVDDGAERDLGRWGDDGGR